MEIFTKSSQETQDLGEKLADTLSHGGVMALYGELGSGKTTFVQGLARGLGIEKKITSPTFVFIRQYKISGEATTSTPARCNTFYHIDLYRIEKSEEVKGLGLEEILSNPANIVVIEWAEKIKNILPRKRIEVKFEILGENERRITTSYKNY